MTAMGHKPTYPSAAIGVCFATKTDMTAALVFRLLSAMSRHFRIERFELETALTSVSILAQNELLSFSDKQSFLRRPPD